MSRPLPRWFGIAAAVTLACVWMGTARAEPRKPAPDYFPLRLHDWWRYKSTQASGATSEFTRTVVAEKKQSDGSLRQCLELSNPKPLIQEWYSKSPSGVLLREEEYLGGGGKVAFDPARPMLELPLKPGVTWTWNGVARTNVRVAETNEVFPKERVQTPAGRFEAVKIVTHIEQGGAQATKTSWYAPGVGLVRQTTDSSGVTSSTELVDYSFKPKR